MDVYTLSTSSAPTLVGARSGMRRQRRRCGRRRMLGVEMPPPGRPMQPHGWPRRHHELAMPPLRRRAREPHERLRRHLHAMAPRCHVCQHGWLRRLIPATPPQRHECLHGHRECLQGRGSLWGRREPSRDRDRSQHRCPRTSPCACDAVRRCNRPWWRRRAPRVRPLWQARQRLWHCHCRLDAQSARSGPTWRGGSMALSCRGAGDGRRRRVPWPGPAPRRSTASVRISQSRIRRSCIRRSRTSLIRITQSRISRTNRSRIERGRIELGRIEQGRIERGRIERGRIGSRQINRSRMVYSRMRLVRRSGASREACAMQTGGLRHHRGRRSGCERSEGRGVHWRRRG